MKKFFCILLTALFCGVLLPASVMAYEKADASVLLSKFSTNASDNAILRGEAAEILTEIVGEEYSDNSIHFNDVDANHKYYSEINSVCAMKLLSGDDKNFFYPDDEISCLDFTVAIIKMAGYTDFAEAAGGYPDGYLKLASKYKLFSGDCQLKGPITQKDAYKIVLKALDIPQCIVKEISVKGDNNSLRYDISDDYTVLEHYFSVTKKTGTVTAVNELYISGYSPCGKGRITLSASSESVTCEIVTEDYEKYLGCEVYYYLDEDTDKVIYIKPKNEVTSIILNYNDIENISSDRTQIKYTDGNRSKEIKLTYDVTVIYNGMNYYGLTSEQLFKPNVRLTAVDTDDDNKFEILYVEEYETVVVSIYDSYGQTVNDKYTGTAYDFNDDSFDSGITFYLDGKQVGFGVISLGDVLSVTTDKDNKKRKVYISKTRPEGYVKSIESSDSKIMLDEDTYTAFFDLNNGVLSPGDYVKLNIDYFGFCVSYEKSPISGGEYAYLLTIEKEDGIDETVRGKFVDQEGNIVVWDFADNFSVNGKRSNYEDLRQQLLTGGTLHQLVCISLRENKVKNIEISNTVTGIEEKSQYDGFKLCYEANSGKCLMYGNNIGTKFYAASLTHAFYIPLNEYGEIAEDEIYAGDFGQLAFKNNISPKLKIYDSGAERISRAIVVYGAAGNTDNYIFSSRLNGTNTFIVEKISTIVDNDGNIKECVTGMMLGMPKTFYAPEEKNFDDLKPGDVVKILSNRANELRAYERLFTLIRNRRDAPSVLSADGIYSEELPAYNNSGFKSKRSVGGLYGCIEEIGISVPSSSTSYQNGVAPRLSAVIRPAGSSDENKLFAVPIYTNTNSDTGSTYVYVYNTRNNTAYRFEAQDIELTGKNAYCFIYDGYANTIIIYE